MITSTETRIQYTPSNPTSGFEFPITYFDDTDINVQVVDSEGYTTTLTLDAVSEGFSVSPVDGNPEFGASITTTETYTSGETITIFRSVPRTQESKFSRGGTLPPEVLNKALDRNVAISQEIYESGTRHISLPITDPDDVNYELPVLELRKNTVIGFDDNGDATVISLVESGAVGVDEFKGLSISGNIIECKIDEDTLDFDEIGNMFVNRVDGADIDNSSISGVKIIDQSVGIDKLETINGHSTGGYILGNMLNIPQTPYEVFVDGDVTLSNDSEDYLVTQNAVKTYIDSLKVDTKYVALTGANIELSASVADTYTYQISAFEGSGIDTDEIRTLHIFVELDLQGAGTPQISATYPDGSTQIVAKTPATDGGTRSNFYGTLQIPINAGQETVDIIIGSSGGTHQYTLIGVTQRV